MCSQSWHAQSTLHSYLFCFAVSTPVHSPYLDAW